MGDLMDMPIILDNTGDILTLRLTPEDQARAQNAVMNKERSRKKVSDKPSPQKKPGVVALGNAAPVLLEVNPNGEWVQKPADNQDEEKLKSIVSQLIDSNLISAAQSYCIECNKQNQKTGGTSNYVPIIMMPILPANQYPFGLDSSIQEEKEEDEETPTQRKGEVIIHEKNKNQKRGFAFKRFSNFDLESQW